MNPDNLKRSTPSIAAQLDERQGRQNGALDKAAQQAQHLHNDIDALTSKLLMTPRGRYGSELASLAAMQKVIADRLAAIRDEIVG